MKNPASKGASMASVQDSTGVDQDRGMCEEKRTDDRPAEGGALNSGRLAPAPLGAQVAQPAQSAQKLHGQVLHGRVGALANAGPAGERETVAKNR